MRAASFASMPADGDDLDGLAIAQRDRAGLVEQQRVDVAGRFDRATAHRQNVALHHAVHAGDADRREQAADRRRDEADQQRDEDGYALVRARIERKRRQRRDRDQKDDRQSGEQDRERDLVGRLLALRAFDQADHAIEEAFAGIRGHAHDDAIGEHARAAGHRAAVAAGFANDRRRFAGDRRLVDRRGAFEHVAVGGNDLVRPRRRSGRPCAGSCSSRAPRSRRRASSRA